MPKKLAGAAILVFILMAGFNCVAPSVARAYTAFNTVRSGLEVEYDPSTFALSTDGQPVTQNWPDSSGNGNDLPVQAGDDKVTYIANGFNGKPTLRLDSLNTGTEAMPWSPGTGDFSLVLMVNRTSGNGSLMRWGCCGGGVSIENGPFPWWQSDQNGYAERTTIGAFSTAPIMYTVTRSGNQMSFYDGNILVATSTGAVDDISGVPFGSAYGGDQTGDIMYFGFYNRALNSTEVNSIAVNAATYFGNKSVALIGNSHYAGAGAEDSSYTPSSLILAKLASIGKSYYSLLFNTYSGRYGFDMATDQLHFVEVDNNGVFAIDTTANNFNGPTVAFLTEMTNDAGTYDDSTTVEHMVTVADVLHESASSTYVAFQDEFPRYTPYDVLGQPYDPTLVPSRADRNSLVFATSTHFDEIMDVGSDPVIGYPGAQYNTAYYADNIHLNDVGNQYWFDNYAWPTIERHLLGIPFTASSTSLTPSASEAAIVWGSSFPAFGTVDFGPNTGYGTSTATESGFTSSHVTNVNELVPCSLYHYRMRVKDNSGNSATSSDQTFLTSSCTGNASVSTTTSATITTGSGGVLPFGNTTITVPSSYSGTTTSATFQAKQLDPTAFFATANTPSGVDKVGNSVLNLEALIDATTTLPTFSAPITITLSYNPSDISGIDPASLTVYRYDTGTGWTSLTGCTVNTGANTVTCQTSNFSDFSLFGTAVTPASSTPTNTGVGVLSAWGSIGIPPGGIVTPSNTLACQPGDLFDTQTGARCSSLSATSTPYTTSSSQSDGSPAAPPVSASTWIFDADLQLKATGAEVRLLQEYLNQHGYVVAATGAGSPGNETDYFGALTKAALIKFQKADGITPAMGYFGPITRAYIAAH